MALDLTKLDPTASGSKGAIKIITYGVTTDTLATVEGANYFQAVASAFRTGDLLHVSAADGNAWYELTVSGTSVTLAGLIDSATYELRLELADIDGTKGTAVRIPNTGTMDLYRTLLANIRTSGPTGATLQAYYNGTAIPTASTLHNSADAAYTVSSVSGLTLAVTAGGILSVISDGGPTGALNGGSIPAAATFRIRRST